MTDASFNSDLSVDYVGRGKPLFWLVAKTLVLTVLTLGIYRFWMKTRLRRYYWSSVQPGGVPFEYTGTGLEKLLGFLIAVVILAIYLGFVNLALSFVGLAFFQGNPLALNLSFLAVVPLIFYARYRGRRYLLSRTRWRGVRFGADQAAGKYMWAALGHTLLSILTLGVLVPRQTFKLEKFVTDRTWYGDVRMEQGGTWTMLLKPWLWIYAGVLLAVASIWGLVTYQNGWMGLGLAAGYLLMIWAMVHFSVQSFRILADHKTVGQGVGLSSGVRTGSVVWIYVAGGFAMFFAMIVVLIALAVIGAFVGSSTSSWDFSFNGFGEMVEATNGDLALLLYGVFGYFLFLMIIGSLAHVLFIQPLLRHYAVKTKLHNAGELDRVGQRAHDENVEAGGFADALDVGAAI